MKISIDKDLHGIRGFQRFMALLIGELKSRYGISVVSKNKKSDIHLMIIHGCPKSGSKNVVRLDGVYYDLSRLNMNRQIVSTIRRADGVVYQSAWCQKFVEGMLKVKANNSAVIWNGTDQSKFLKCEPEKHEFEKIFLACSHWRVNKRLKSIVEAFLRLRKITGRNFGLFIIGKPDYNSKSSAVSYFGKIKGDRLFGLYKTANYMCHICHLDACPNAVVEGLSAGLPVLCNNIGGTPEIVGKDGVILNLDLPFNFRPIKEMSVVGPKSVNVEMLTDGMLQMLNQDWRVSRPDLDISEVAKKYYEFFERLLS